MTDDTRPNPNRHVPDQRDLRLVTTSDKPQYQPVPPGHWYHEGTTYEIATMPILIIEKIAFRRKQKGLFIHPKMSKRLKEVGIEL